MKQKVIFWLSLLTGLMLINAGMNKFLNYIPVPEDLPENMKRINDAFMEIGWLLPLIGAAEILGGILFIIPKTRALGALIIFPVMVGILLTHIIIMPSGLVMAAVLMAINLWAIYENREKYLPMIR
jgi:putative oxidoreductase